MAECQGGSEVALLLGSEANTTPSRAHRGSKRTMMSRFVESNEEHEYDQDERFL